LTADFIAMESVYGRLKPRNQSASLPRSEAIKSSLLPADESSIINMLKKRQYYHYTPRNRYLEVIPIQKRINDIFNDIHKVITSLQVAIDSGNINNVENEVSFLIGRLFDTTNTPESIFTISPTKRQEREAFVCFGGIHQLLRLFSPPYSKADAREMNGDSIKLKTEFWNEVLVILREVAFTIPSITDNTFSDQQIIFLFTLLSHSSVFDNAINLLEEILAVRNDAFQLGLVPDLFSLINRLSIRQLAHFCRTLSLMLFEPEDRQLMDGVHTLRSLELLHLRKDRMMKSTVGVDRNQFVIIEMPGFLDKLVLILKIMNYGPTLNQITSHNISAQTPLASDIIHFLTTSSSSSTSPEADWKRLQQLDNVASRNRIGIQNTRTTAQEEESMNNLLEIFSPTTRSSAMDVNGLYRILQLARDIGLNPSASSNYLSSMPDVDLSYDINGNLSIAMLELEMMAQTRSSARSINSSSSSSHNDPAKARKELQFHAMLLVPHHVEVLFVICSLLAGRNKIHVQRKLYQLKIHDQFVRMFDRMSWQDAATPRSSSSSLEHIHGPGCECNPENAVRIQLLRLIHNYYDRDFIHNEIKAVVLTEDEKSWLKSYSSGSSSIMPRDLDKGILSLIINAFLTQPSDSVYRFWLSSCLEAFLRGNSRSYEQLYVAESGVICNITANIKTVAMKPSFNLQTAFDLLGELIKCNDHALEILEVALGDDSSFRFVMDILMNNLIDSNVFVRSLFLTMEFLSDLNDYREQRFVDFSCRLDNGGFLFDSWIPFAPRPLSKQGIQIFTNPPVKKIDRVVKVAATAAGEAYTIQHSNPARIRDASKKASEEEQTKVESEATQHARQQQRASSSSTSLVSLTDGIKGAIIGIRDAASQLLSSNQTSSKATSQPKSQAQPSIPPVRNHHETSSSSRTMIVHITHSNPSPPASKIDGELCIEDRPSIISRAQLAGGCVDEQLGDMLMNDDPSHVQVTTHDDECDDLDFITPPEQPKYSRSSSSSSATATSTSINISANTIKSTIQHPPADRPNFNASWKPSSLAAGAAAVDRMTEDAEEEKRMNRRGWNLSDRYFRLSYFLTNEREAILLRLMSCISLRTINHENICCLNTALLIFLLAHRR
jgi:hypothetical protein